MKGRIGVAAACAVLILALVASTAFGATPWTRIDKLLVDHEAYVIGTLEVDGAMTLDGAITAGGGVDLNGSALTIDADADTILDESADDVVGLTMGAATGAFSVLTGNAKVGNGTPTVSQDGEDFYVEGQFEVDGEAQLDGALDANSTADFAGAITANANLDMNGTTLYLGADQGIYMDEVTDGDYRFVMGAGTDVISYTVGNVAIGNGKPTSAQTGEDLYVEGMLEVDGTVYHDGYTYLGDRLYLADNTLYADSDSDITIVGSTNNLALTTVAAGTVQVAVGNLKVGDASPTVTQDGEDAFVEGQFEVDGEAQFDGAIDANSTADFASTVAIGGDVTLTADTTGGNAGAKTEFIGLPRIKLAGVGVKDGSGEVELDDSPTGEWSALTVSTTLTADTSYYKVGANSLKIAWNGAAPAGSGATSATPNGDWTGMKSIGFWVYADKAFTAAQLTLYLTDSTDPATFNTCAYATPSVWQYCEVDITSLDGTTGDAVTDIDVRMAAGLPVPINIYIDQMAVWAAADEVTLGVALQQDGDLGFINALTGAALDPSADYVIAYRSGVDYVVVISDLDPDGMFGMIAY